MGFGSKSQNCVWKQKTQAGKRGSLEGYGGGQVQPGPPPIRVSPPPGGAPQPWSSAESTPPPLQRSDPGHGHFSPSAHGTATHPALPHIGAPRGDARSCSGHSQTAKNSGFVCKVQSQGLAALGINYGY